MSMRRLKYTLACGAMLLLGGCGAGSLVGLVGDLTGGGDDGDFVLAIQALSHTWRVNNYSGGAVGAVSVPTSANLNWTFRTDFTFEVTSDQPVSIGGAVALLYDEAGTWRMIDSKTGQIALTLTRHAGLSIASVERVEAAGSYSQTGNQLVLTTSAIGPGSVRYVMSR